MQEVIQYETPRMTREARAAVERFAKAILHGNDDHRDWLLEAASAFNAGIPLPAPRGKGVSVL